MTTLQDAIDSTIAYLKANMSTVSAGTLQSSAIVDELGTTGLPHTSVVVSLIADRPSYTVGGYPRETALLQFYVSAQTKANRNSIREDIYDTLNAGMSSITNVQTLRVVGKRNLEPVLTEKDEVGTYVHYVAIVEVEIEYS